MNNTASPPRKSQTAFADPKSIRNFAGASSALTILLNVIMLIYAQLQPAGMPNPALAGLAVFLCLAYSLSFLKKDPASGIPEYIWLTALNSALLFSSLTGINSILKKAGEAYTSQNTAQASPQANTVPKETALRYYGKTTEASFGLGDLKNIIIPKQAWFNPAPVTTIGAQKIKVQANQLTTKALETVAQTEVSINKVIAAQKVSNQNTDSLSTALHNLRDQYIQTLAQLSSYQATIADLNQKLKACSGSVPAPTNLSNLQKEMESSKLLQADQQHQQVQQQQVQQQQVQQKRQQQQQKQMQLIQLQQQQVHRVKYNMQQQVH